MLIVDNVKTVETKICSEICLELYSNAIGLFSGSNRDAVRKEYVSFPMQLAFV